MKARTSAFGASELPERCALTPKKQGAMAQPPPRTLSSNTLACVNRVIDRVALGSDSPGDGAGGEGGGAPVLPGPLHVALQMLGRPVTQVMYFCRPRGALVSLNEKNVGSFTGEEIDSLLRSMTGVFVPLLTQ